jgi:CRP-like cAMP-binding protein
LPRSLAHRVIAALDDGPLESRSNAAAVRLEREIVDRDEAVDGELRGDDPLARDLVVSALGSTGRTEHRDAISAAAEDAARSFDPLEMFRRRTGADEGAEAGATKDEEDDVPRSVETMMVLSRIGMFSELTTRQLDELADVVTWQVASPGTAVIAEGDHGDSMYFVASGSLAVEVDGAKVNELGAGEPFGEMAIFEDEQRSASIVASTRARIGRIDRSDFEELVEDVPGIALAICRVLSRRVREANRATTAADQ